MTFEEKIKEKAFSTESSYRESVFFKVVKLDDVLTLLPHYIIIRKQGDLHGEKALDAVIAWMHGKTVVDKQKLREFVELLKNRPKTIFPPYSRTAWCNPEKSAECFELLEKKFRELTK